MAESAPFDPQAILRTLEEHGVRYVLVGGLAATLYGSPHVTTDVDIAPETSKRNLTALSAALGDLEARIRTEGVPGGLVFDTAPETLERTEILNLTTRYGDLDLTFIPAGTQGYADLQRHAVEITVEQTTITVASLADVIRSKQAAGREKDLLTLPTLRRLLERLGETGDTP